MNLFIKKKLLPSSSFASTKKINKSMARKIPGEKIILLPPSLPYSLQVSRTLTSPLILSLSLSLFLFLFLFLFLNSLTHSLPLFITLYLSQLCYLLSPTIPLFFSFILSLTLPLSLFLTHLLPPYHTISLVHFFSLILILPLTRHF